MRSLQGSLNEERVPDQLRLSVQGMEVCAPGGTPRFSFVVPASCIGNNRSHRTIKCSSSESLFVVARSGAPTALLYNVDLKLDGGGDGYYMTCFVANMYPVPATKSDSRR